jgi:hypothetical protein
MNLVNILVHHERRGREGTEIDVLAVRFPHRRELAMSGEPMIDHPIFDSDNQVDIIIAEVKTKLCDLNGPWTEHDGQNMHRVLYAVGAFPEPEVPSVAEALYKYQFYAEDGFRVRLFALGQGTNPELPSEVVQLTWEEILSFIYERLKKYQHVKAQHRQWDQCGRQLYDKMQVHQSAKDYIQDILAHVGG